MLVPYLVWSAFFMLFTPVNELASPESMRLALRGVVLGSTWYHLYFVPIILGVYALTPVASVALRRMGTSGGAVVFLLSLVVGIVTPVEVARSGLQDRAFMALVVLIASYLPYAALGAWYSTVRSSSWGLALAQRGWVPLLVAGAVLRGWFGAVVPWPTTPYAAVVLAVCMNLLQCLALLLLARVLAERWPHRARLATPWASVVLGVYLAHPLLIKLLYPLVDNGILPPAVWVATVWPAVTVACFTGVRALSKYRSLRWVHGVAPR